jgi:hypothetical protein
VRPGLLLFPLLVGAAPAAAQAPALTITLQSDIARIQTTALLADGKFLALMRSGFPLRLHYRLELWRSRGKWFDQLVSELAWDDVAHHDPLADEFVLFRTDGRVTRYSAPDALERALELPYRVALASKGTGKFYVLSRLDVTTLNDSDLDELTRWLKGDLSPAVSGQGNVGSALARGAQRIIVRIAGLPRVALEARSPEFTRE